MKEIADNMKRWIYVDNNSTGFLRPGHMFISG